MLGWQDNADISRVVWFVFKCSVTDETTKVTVQLVDGPDVVKYAGKKVEVTGSSIPGGNPLGGASQLVRAVTIKPVGDKKLDGVSLKPLLTGSTTNWPERSIVTFYNNRLSLRTQQFRFDAGGGQGKKATSEALFDMVADPGQRKDISKEQGEVTQRLRAEAAKWRTELSPKAGKDDRPFTVGYSASTPLPARDGVPHGGVQRSDTAPNCSFFTNWTSPDDRITWDVEVGKAGRYEAIVYYSCAAGDVGSTIELSLGSVKLQTKVNEAHDPPLYGKEHDRVERRAESYMKDFKPMKLGTFDLPSGHGELALRALQVAGKQVMDVRYVVLNRLE